MPSAVVEPSGERRRRRRRLLRPRGSGGSTRSAGTPSTYLQDGQSISVDASGFLPGAGLWFLQCPAGATTAGACGPRSPTGDALADDTGHATGSFTVHRLLIGSDGTRTACDRVEGACEVVVGDPTDFAVTASFPIGFATLAPPPVPPGPPVLPPAPPAPAGGGASSPADPATRVLDATVTRPGDPSLAFTGAAFALPTALGALILAAGAALALAARRRRSALQR